MPSFKGVLDETQMWQLALFVANADKLPDSAKQILAPQPAAAAAMPAMPPATAKTSAGKK
jgi:hypothetical protein